MDNQSVSQKVIKIIISVGLGFLTLALTPLIAYVITKIFSIVMGGGANNSLASVTGDVFAVQGLGGYFVIVTVIVFVISLVGDFILAYISRYVTKSNKLATLTFFVAVILQLISMVSHTNSNVEKGKEMMQTGITNEQSYAQYASIAGTATILGQDPYSVTEGVNGKLVKINAYNKIRITVPVKVVKAGSYDLSAQYSSVGVMTRMKEVEVYLRPGDQTIVIELNIGDASVRNPYTQTSLSGASANLVLSYITNVTEVGEKISTNPQFNSENMSQYMQYEVSGSNSGSNGKIKKFIERKKVVF